MNCSRPASVSRSTRADRLRSRSSRRCLNRSMSITCSRHTDVLAKPPNAATATRRLRSTPAEEQPQNEKQQDQTADAAAAPGSPVVVASATAEQKEEDKDQQYRIHDVSLLLLSAAARRVRHVAIRVTAAVAPFGEFLDHLLIEGRNIVRLP